MANKKTNNKTKKTPRKRKSSQLETMARTTGKSYDSSIERAKELEEILGLNKTSPFKTTDARVLEEQMSEMNLTDLQALAVKAGVFPSGNKTVLKNKLRKAFKGVKGSGTVQLSEKPFLDPTDPKNKAAIDLYRQGF
jgi:hypothetical protein